MANIKSQIKRNRQNDKRRLRNRVYRGTARIAVKNARTAIDSGVPESTAALASAISALDKAAETLANGKDLPEEEYYICPVCGHTHRGKMEGRCPICNTPAEKFMKID